MELSDYIPQRSFWIATTLVIIVAIFVCPFVANVPTEKGIFVSYLWLTLEMALLSGFCVGLIQIFQMRHLSAWEKVRWSGITVLSTTIGWCTVFAIVVLFLRLSPNLPILNSRFFIAVFYGLLTGGLMGAIIGLVNGFLQSRVLSQPACPWIVGSVISWGMGIGISLALLFAALSQIDWFL